MEVAWKWTLHRSAEGSLPACWALAGSQAHRTPEISKMSGRFTNMSFPLNQSVRRFHKLCALRVMAEQAGQVQHVVEHENHHQDQVRPQTEQRNAHAPGHRHGTALLGVDLFSS